MLAAISQADIQRSGIGTISVGQVGIGPIQIGQLVLTDLDLNVAADGAELRNFRVTISHAMRLDWHVHIEIPAHEDIDESGSEDLGVHSFHINFGDVSVPGLQNLNVGIASLTAESVAATANPLVNLQLGAAVAEQIRARNVQLPAQGFTIAGLGLGGLQVGGVGVPAASVEEVSIGRVRGDALPLGQLTLSNLALPSASIADIMSQSVDVTATPLGKAFHLDFGILELTLKIKPEAKAQIDQVLIRNARASTSIGRIELSNVVAPYEFLNLSLSQIGIETVQIPNVAIA